MYDKILNGKRLLWEETRNTLFLVKKRHQNVRRSQVSLVGPSGKVCESDEAKLVRSSGFTQGQRNFEFLVDNSE
jgi:hypothetical protein